MYNLVGVSQKRESYAKHGSLFLHLMSARGFSAEKQVRSQIKVQLFFEFVIDGLELVATGFEKRQFFETRSPTLRLSSYEDREGTCYFRTTDTAMLDKFTFSV